MTDRLDEIRARAEAATPGEWIGSSTPSGRKYGVISIRELTGEAYPIAVLSGKYARRRHPDTQFLAHAPTDIDYLLAEVERLQRVVNTVPDLLDWMKRYRGGDPALDPEEYWIRSEDTANALAALTEGGES